VLEAQGSVLTNKYAEGYPGRATTAAASSSTSPRRWRSSAPRSCSARVRQRPAALRRQANQAVFLALLQPGDTFMGLDLAAGGHLTHGSPVNMSGKWFNAVPTACAATTSWSTWTRSSGSPRAQAEADHRRRLGLFAPSRLRALPRDRRRGRRAI
jgi:glycine/serine hydroxymethyltransferase